MWVIPPGLKQTVGPSLVAACRSMSFPKAVILLLFLLMLSADRFIYENPVCTGFGFLLCKGRISISLSIIVNSSSLQSFWISYLILIRWPSYLTKMALPKGTWKHVRLLSLFWCSTSRSPAFACNDVKTFLMYLLLHKLVSNRSHPRLRADWWFPGWLGECLILQGPLSWNYTSYNLRSPLFCPSYFFAVVVSFPVPLVKRLITWASENSLYSWKFIN